jgi:hypothetical protein
MCLRVSIHIRTCCVIRWTSITVIHNVDYSFPFLFYYHPVQTFISLFTNHTSIFMLTLIEPEQLTRTYWPTIIIILLKRKLRINLFMHFFKLDRRMYVCVCHLHTCIEIPWDRQIIMTIRKIKIAIVVIFSFY